MKIIEIKSLQIPEVKIIKSARFHDNRGYFTESFKINDLQNTKEIHAFKKIQFLQGNESFSKKNVIRGLHFQYNPYMGKLVRPLYGRFIDVALDIRKNSATFGQIVGYELETNTSKDYFEWIWVPIGFAHGVCFLEDTLLEYMCSGDYSPGCELCISPLATDIDWSICDKNIKNTFIEIVSKTELITDKDRNGLTINTWTNHSSSNLFL